MGNTDSKWPSVPTLNQFIDDRKTQLQEAANAANQFFNTEAGYLVNPLAAQAAQAATGIEKEIKRPFEKAKEDLTKQQAALDATIAEQGKRQTEEEAKRAQAISSARIRSRSAYRQPDSTAFTLQLGSAAGGKKAIGL